MVSLRILAALCLANLDWRLDRLLSGRTGGICGIDFSTILPFSIMRTWRVQLAIFWVPASYLATGIL